VCGVLEDREPAAFTTSAPQGPARATVAASVFVPAAAVSIVELGAVLVTAAPVDRPYAARAAALGVLTVMVVAGLMGVALAALRVVRSVRTAISVAAALAVFSSVLFVLANGLPPLTGDRFAPGRSLAIAAAAALLAAAARGLAGASRSSCLAVWVEPALIAGAIGGGYALLRVLGIPPASGRGLALWAGLAAFALSDGVVLHLLSRRVPEPLRAPGVTLVAIGVCLYSLFPITAFLEGRRPFAAISVRGRSPGASRVASAEPSAPPWAAGAAPGLPSVGRRALGADDVLLIVMDTTRADFAPAPPGSRSPTPALERLAHEGVRFTNAFSTSCWTLPAHGSLFTGLLPSEHGATWATEHLSPDVPTLAERFRSAGWRTAAFSANPWITPEFGFGRGFERYEIGDADRRPLRPWLLAVSRRGPWSAASTLFEDAGGLTLASEALRFLNAREDARPAFAFLNLLEPHLPYDPPGAALGSLEGSGWTRRELDAIDQDRIVDLSPRAVRSARDMEGLRLLYAAEIAYDDGLVGRILSGLERAGRLDTTAIVVTSDHGENLGDHAPLDHQLGLWDSLVRIPLIVRAPAVPAGQIQSGLASLTDVPAALGRYSGFEPIGGEQRHDAVFFEYDRSPHLLGLIRDRLKLDARPWDRDLTGVRTRDEKWIVATDGRNEAYDLTADPGERHNLAASWAGGETAPPAPFDALASRILSMKSQRAREHAPPKKTSPPMSDESEERLRSLGYVR